MDINSLIILHGQRRLQTRMDGRWSVYKVACNSECCYVGFVKLMRREASDMGYLFIHFNISWILQNKHAPFKTNAGVICTILAALQGSCFKEIP